MTCLDLTSIKSESEYSAMKRRRAQSENLARSSVGRKQMSNTKDRLTGRILARVFLFSEADRYKSVAFAEG